jgi:hypothetical protein
MKVKRKQIQELINKKKKAHEPKSKSLHLR